MKDPLKRTNINITEKEHTFLLKISEEKGLSMSELIRRILDEYIEENNNGN
jgi:metal-responsive CopG/Arc/MetJ family transcriptional regulator